MASALGLTVEGATSLPGLEGATGGSVTDTITYEQGIEKAKNFREKYYPQYIKLYDSIADRQSKGETIRQDERQKLLKMHRRLEELKREIGVAAKRGEA